MANVGGPGGSVSISTGFAANFQRWTASLIPTVVDTTGFADAGNRTSMPTAQIVTGTAIGTGIDGSASLPAGVTGSTPTMASYLATITLTAYSGGTMSFQATVTMVALDRPADGKLDYALSFQSNGAITGRF